MIDLNHKAILLTGGTGSFGKMFTEYILKNYPDVKRLVILSRDELKQFEMAQTFSVKKYPCIRYFLGDVRDLNRLYRAFEGIDVVIHAAALKQVPMAEYNPTEFIKTNINGAENVINAAIDCGVKHVVALSTDKAASPINLYGATKLCSDKLFVAANNMRGSKDIRFSVVRYGNVMGSRGSVIPFFLKQRKSGILPITHPDMTRFNISLLEGVELVFYALSNAIGGEIFIPKIPSYRITTLANAIAPECEVKVIGIRPGEKIHEEMISETDSLNTLETANHYIIVPSNHFGSQSESLVKYTQKYNAQLITESFRYTSGNNQEWLDEDQLRSLIKEHVDPNFNV